MTALPSDQNRLERWVRDHGRAVRGYLLALVRRAADADDLLQEVFRKAWLARDRYEDRGQERAYLLRIADRLVCDRVRKQQREVLLDGDGWEAIEPSAADLSPAAMLEREEWKAELHGALDLLSEPQKRVLLLRYYGGLEFAVIAEQMELPLGTVLSHSHRGLAALKKLLTKERT